MDLQITTPAIFFPTASLLMLAYTNRFLGLSSRVRDLHTHWQATHEAGLARQIALLRRRIVLIRNMQFSGVLSLLLGMCSMLAISLDAPPTALWLFVGATIALMLSLVIALNEIRLSGNALDVLLSEMEK